MKEEITCPHCDRTKQRTDEDKKALLNRLSRIEGQIRGMVEREAYCPDVLTQAAAASAALNSFARMLLNDHIRTCVTEDVRRGNDDAVDELLSVLQKFMH